MRGTSLGAAAFAAALFTISAAMLHAQNVNELRPPTAFADIADREARSRAILGSRQGNHQCTVHELPPCGRSSDPRK